MEFANIIQGSRLMEYCILGGLHYAVNERLRVANSPCWPVRARLLREDLLRFLPKESVVYILGSVAIGLATEKSDIDFYVDLDGNSYNAEQTSTQRRDFHGKLLYYYLTRNGIKNVFELRETVPEARVPVLRLTHIRTGIDLDVSVANGVGVENSKLLKMYLDSDQRVKWLVLLIHEWMSQVGLMGKTPLFRPYALSWLVVFFLMRTKPRVVCPVIELMDSKQKVVGGWNCNFGEALPRTENRELRINLLSQFLAFVASQDFPRWVICPLTGDMMLREAFKNPGDLPSCFMPYLRKVLSKKSQGLNVRATMCLQDPVDLTHNITQLVDQGVLIMFQQLCRDSLDECRLVIHPLPRL